MKNGQSRETGNKTKKKTTQYVLDTTTCMCKQTQKNVRLTWALLQTTESNAHIYI